jgi:thiosulfate dehydrogenase (quinone) large subunit
MTGVFRHSRDHAGFSRAGASKDEIAYLLLRVTLGANLFLHGFSRLIGNHAVFAAYLENQMRNAPLPGFVLHFVMVVLPWCEGSIGL